MEVTTGSLCVNLFAIAAVLAANDNYRPLLEEIARYRPEFEQIAKQLGLPVSGAWKIREAWMELKSDWYAQDAP